MKVRNFIKKQAISLLAFTALVGGTLPFSALAAEREESFTSLYRVEYAQEEIEGLHLQSTIWHEENWQVISGSAAGTSRPAFAVQDSRTYTGTIHFMNYFYVNQYEIIQGFRVLVRRDRWARFGGTLFSSQLSFGAELDEK